MSYHAASFNRNQTAIRAMQDIRAGVNAAPADVAQPAVKTPIRYAKDLVPAVASAATVHTAAHTAQAQASEPQPQAVHASGSSNQQSTQAAFNQHEHQPYTSAQKLDAGASKDDKDIAAVLWLASLIFLMIPGMLVLLNHNASPYLKQQARESLNWTVTFVLGSIACTILTLLFIGGPLQILLSIAHLVFCLMGANAAHKGVTFRVPMAWRPLKD